MTVMRRGTRFAGLALTAVLTAVLALVAAHPAAASGLDRAGHRGLSGGGHATADAHPATRVGSRVVVKRLAGTEQAVIPAAVAVGRGSDDVSSTSPTHQAAQGVGPGAVAARAPPGDGTSRS
jgi:hypothetical protein